jgi:phosphoribosylformylglycinamidine synthase
VLVTVPAGDVDRVTDLAARHGVPVTEIGETGGAALVVSGQLEVHLPTLRDAWTRTLPDALG